MRILYWGIAGEIGAKLCNSLSTDHSVAALFISECEYETPNVKVLPTSDSVIPLLASGDAFDVIVCFGENLRPLEYMVEDLSGFSGPLPPIYFLEELDLYNPPCNALDINGVFVEALAAQKGISAIRVCTSPLYGEMHQPHFVSEICSSLNSRGSLLLEGHPDDICDCIFIDDFCLAVKELIETRYDAVLVDIATPTPFSMWSFVEQLRRVYPAVVIELDESAAPSRARKVHHFDSWKPARSFLEDIDICFEVAEGSRSEEKQSLFLRRFRLAGKAIIYVAFFLLVELYSSFVFVSSGLQFVDLRLLFVVTTALLGGMRLGLFSAMLCTVSSIAHALVGGTQWYVIAFNINNWIPFAVYFVCGIVFGSMKGFRIKNEEKGDW